MRVSILIGLYFAFYHLADLRFRKLFNVEKLLSYSLYSHPFCPSATMYHLFVQVTTPHRVQFENNLHEWVFKTYQTYKCKICFHIERGNSYDYLFYDIIHTKTTKKTA